MLKFRATYRATGRQDFSLTTFLQTIAVEDGRLVENTRLLIRVFSLSAKEVERMRDSITDPSARSIMIPRDSSAKIVGLFLGQQAANMLPPHELVYVVEVPEPASEDDGETLADKPITLITHPKDF